MIEAMKQALKLEEMHKTAKGFFREEWPAKVAQWKPIIEAVMKKENLETLPAAIKMAKILEEKEEMFSVMVVFAVAVEMIETKN